MAERTDIVNDLNTCGVLNGDPLYPLIIRARDEIMALRSHVMREAEAIRDRALEEAEMECMNSGAIVREARLCAAAVRALKNNK